MADSTDNTMLYWLARAAKELREEAGRMQVHIAATMSIDQSSIYRFEQGRAWPRQTDLMIAAYAEDLDVADARDIWRRALDMWEAQGQAPTVKELSGATLRSADAASAFEREIGDAAQAPEKSGSPSAGNTPSKRTRRRAG